MGMTLLKKVDVDQKKQAERQLEINEGKKLATRVDTLRELAAEEEKNLTEFRNRTVSLIQKEIDDEILKRDALLADIDRRRKELFSLSGDLDSSFLYYVNSERALIQKEKRDLEVKNARVDQLQKDLERLQIETALEEKRYTEGQEENAHNLVQSRKLVADAEKMVEKNNRIASKNATQWTESLKTLQKRSEELDARHTSLNLLQNDLKKKEEELVRREFAALALELKYYTPIRKI